MAQFLKVLKEVAIFMLGAQILLHLGPGKQYEKYGKMMVSLLVLAQLAEPVLSFVQDTQSESFFDLLAYYEQQNEAFADRLKLMGEESDSLVWDGMAESVEEKLMQAAKVQGVRIERVMLSEGKLIIEAGALIPGEDHEISEKRLTQVFAEELGIAENRMEVLVLG